ncbi:MAG: caspase family protein, partial [Cyanobacteria bacterium J06576_12]
VKSVLINPNIGGFEEQDVTLLQNPDPQVVNEAIYSLFSEKRKDDLILLFFSGHGIKDDEGRLYLATRRTRKNDSGELVVPTAVAASFVHDCMNRSRSKHQIVILDSCFSGAFAEGLSAKDDGTVNVKEQLGGEGRVVLTSSSSTQYSFEQEDQELSLYTRFLIEGLKTGDADLDNDDVISINELHDYASQRVREVRPELRPEIYSVREGFKIRLAKVFIANPKQRYQKEVIRYGKRGRLTIVSRGILDTFRVKLGISSEDAQAIEESVLEPYREDFDRRLLDYERIFTEALQKGNLNVSDSIRSELTNFQQHLDLRNEDTVPVEARIEKELREYQAKLDEYEEIFKNSLLQEYPLSDAASSFLKKTKERLELRSLDASSLEARVRANVEQYRQDLDTYEQLLNKAAEESYPISERSRIELESERQKLDLSELDVASIESKISAKVQTYRQKLSQYEQAMIEATERKRFPDNAAKQRLQNMWRTLELKETDVKKIDTAVYFQVEQHQKNLDEYEKAYSEAANQNIPLNSEDAQALKRLKNELGISDKEARNIAQLVTEEVRSYLDKVKQYEQVLSSSMKYEQNLSPSTRDDLQRLQSILELPDDIVRGIEARIVAKRIGESNSLSKPQQDERSVITEELSRSSVETSEATEKKETETEPIGTSAHDIYKAEVAKYVGYGVPLEDSHIQSVLRDLQLKLGLSSSEAGTIEQEAGSLPAPDKTKVLEMIEAKNLRQYEQRGIEFFHAGISPNDDYVRRELASLRRKLGISDIQADDIEQRILGQSSKKVKVPSSTARHRHSFDSKKPADQHQTQSNITSKQQRGFVGTTSDRDSFLRSFWFGWILTNLVAMSFGASLAVAVSLQIDTGEGLGSGYVGELVYGMVNGGIVGLAQWLFLRRINKSINFSWAVMTVLGLSVGISVAYFVFSSNFSYEEETAFLYFAPYAAIEGCFAGIFQCINLMKKSKWGTKWSWVAWSTLSYMVAGAISIGVIFFRIPAYRPAEFIAGAVSGLLIGLITSYPLWKIVVKRKAST